MMPKADMLNRVKKLIEIHHLVLSDLEFLGDDVLVMAGKAREVFHLWERMDGDGLRCDMDKDYKSRDPEELVRAKFKIHKQAWNRLPPS